MTRHITIGFFSVLLMVGSAAAQMVLYVDDDADPNGDGLTWATAYDDLQDALSAAPDEIRVAGGTYKPSVRSEPATPRTETFQLVSGVALYGGYVGLADPNDPDSRDIVLYKTILSGDIGMLGNHAVNCYHVVTGSGTDATAVLDGFTVIEGNADAASPYREGAGMYNDYGSPTVTNCTFCKNTAILGGGMYNTHSNPALTNCTFSNNSADWDGGGMNNEHSSPTLTSCIFSDNSAGVYGGGIVNWGGNPTLINCVFSRNVSDNVGGAISSRSSSTPTATNCTIIETPPIPAVAGYITTIAVQHWSIALSGVTRPPMILRLTTTAARPSLLTVASMVAGWGRATSLSIRSSPTTTDAWAVVRPASTWVTTAHPVWSA